MTFKAQFATTGAANFIILATGIATGILSARLLGPEGRGELAAITAFSGTVSALALIGVPNALIYYAARDPERSAGYLATGGLIAAAASIPFAVAAYYYIPHLLSHQRPSVIWAARVYLLQIAIYLVAVSPGEILHGAGHFWQWNALRVIPRILALLVCLTAWVLEVRRADFFALGYLFTAALVAVPLWYWLLPVLRGRAIPTIRQGREILGFAVPSVLTLLPKSLNLGLDQIMMSAMLPASTLGLYAAAVSWSAGSSPLLQAMGLTLFPRVASVTDQKARANLMARGARFTTLLALSLMVLFLIVTPKAVPLLFGARFAGAVPAGLILVVAGLFSGLNLVLGEGLQGLGHPAAVLQAETAGLVVTAASLAILLPRFQIIGAAVASLLAYMTVTGMLLRQACLLTNLKLTDFLIPGPSEIQSGWQTAQVSLANLGKRVSRAPALD